MADELERIVRKIEALCEAALQLRSSYLLSALGKDLDQDLQALKYLTKGTLSDFIREQFAGRYEVVGIGEFGNVQALIRAPNSEVAPAAELSENDTAQTETIPKSGPRFNYRFWAAFSVPYREGKRFLNLSDFTFQDVPSGEPPLGHLEIAPSFIAPTAIRDRDKVIVENINRWIQQNQLEKSRFYQTRLHRDAISTAPSLLEAVITALDHKQLSTTSMSLDVVAALMRKRV